MIVKSKMQLLYKIIHKLSKKPFVITEFLSISARNYFFLAKTIDK